MAKIVSTGSTLSTTEFYRKRQEARRKKLFVILAVLAALLVAVLFVLRLERLKISSIEILGTNALLESEVRKAAEGVLDGYYLWLIPKRDSFIYPKGEIRQALRERFPRFSSIGLSLEGVRNLTISVMERKPFALYCPGEECYFLDNTGFIFDKAPIFSEGVYFVYRDGASLPPGSPIMSPEEFRAVASFVKELPALASEVALEPRELLISGDELRLSLASKALIIWNRGRDAGEVFLDLKSFLSNPEIEKESQFWSKIALLDLRTENKVFYTFK